MILLQSLDAFLNPLRSGRAVGCPACVSDSFASGWRQYLRATPLALGEST